MHSHLVQITSKIAALARSGCITSARKLFDELLHRDTIAWNAMLTGYSQLGLHQQPLFLFQSMRINNTKPDDFSFTATLNACASVGELRYGTKVHALVIVLGYQFFLPVNNSLIDMYGKCLDTTGASKVFNEMCNTNEVSWCSLLFAYTNAGQFNSASEVFYMMPKRVNIAWNTMIAGHAKFGEIELCLALFREMQKSSCRADQWTFSALMNACGESLDLLCGCMLHAFVIKSGWGSAVEAKNSILTFYSKLGCHNDAIKEFDSIVMLNQVSWNAIIDTHMRTGDTSEAFNAFQQMPEKNVVSWTSMITGYARNGDGEQAVSFFVDMMRNDLHPDDYSLGAVLHACSSLAVLQHGRMVHGCVIHQGFHAYVYVGNGLVNMYAKCGDIEGSWQAFNDILNKDLVSWNAMLFGFGLHGLSNQSIQLYEKMLASGTKPDIVTFIGLLITCSHSGLIEKGRVIFESMRAVYGLSYEKDHVACMVDMLGRGGYLAEAKELADKYLGTGIGITSTREALLGACSVQGDVGLGTYFGERLKISEPRREMSFVVLSNLYCTSGQWKEAEMVRKAMVNSGIKKTPGCSWIEVRNEVTSFVAGTQSHKYMEELCNTLYSLHCEMRIPSLVDLGIEYC